MELITTEDGAPPPEIYGASEQVDKFIERCLREGHKPPEISMTIVQISVSAIHSMMTMTTDADPALRRKLLMTLICPVLIEMRKIERDMGLDSAKLEPNSPEDVLSSGLTALLAEAGMAVVAQRK